MSWEVRTADDTWFLTSQEVHVKPTDDLILHGWSGCVCVPAREELSAVTVFTHHALDGRELLERVDNERT